MWEGPQCPEDRVLAVAALYERRIIFPDSSDGQDRRYRCFRA
jgi:hypothetical protein